MKVHWSGGIKLPKSNRLAGFPACVSGSRAIEINERGGTEGFDPDAVTCKRCIKLLEQAGELSKTPEDKGRRKLYRYEVVVIVDVEAGDEQFSRNVLLSHIPHVEVAGASVEKGVYSVKSWGSASYRLVKTTASRRLD